MRDLEQLGPTPHHDPTSWGRILNRLDIASIFVVLSSWLGPRLRRHLTVEDIWQETLWAAWRDREQHEWRDLHSFRTWLLSIAKNRIRDAARGLSRTKRGGDHEVAPFSTLAGSGSVSGMLPARSTTPSRVAGHQERAIVMETALSKLPSELAAVVRMRLFEELPTRVVAQRLGLPLSTAKERLLRGVSLYRRYLHELARGEFSAAERT